MDSSLLNNRILMAAILAAVLAYARVLGTERLTG